MAIPPVLASKDARDELPRALKRFREEGIAAAPLIFGAHRKAEAVIIPFELYAELLPIIEDMEIAALVRQRAARGPATPLSEVAGRLGLDPGDYR
ncbi:hypothetical protein [Mycetocola sp. JXN-3]|uniref:hypothetical protein n=1 Tax=Mycetocola sp. JXN-3 TaxID=2116510 RepID=UPI00165D1ECC|nr:hypothetical protein [Mycetocola sp. JXN-3]